MTAAHCGPAALAGRAAAARRKGWRDDWSGDPARILVERSRSDALAALVDRPAATAARRRAGALLSWTLAARDRQADGDLTAARIATASGGVAKLRARWRCCGGLIPTTRAARRRDRGRRAALPRRSSRRSREAELETTGLPHDHPRWVRDAIAVSQRARRLLERLGPPSRSAVRFSLGSSAALDRRSAAGGSAWTLAAAIVPTHNACALPEMGGERDRDRGRPRKTNETRTLQRRGRRGTFGGELAH